MVGRQDPPSSWRLVREPRRFSFECLDLISNIAGMRYSSRDQTQAAPGVNSKSPQLLHTVSGALSSEVPSDTVVILAVEQPSQIEIRSSLKYPSQLCSCDDAQDLKMEKIQMGTRLPWYRSFRTPASRGKTSMM